MLLGSMTVAGGPLMGLPLRPYAGTTSNSLLSLVQLPTSANTQNAEDLARGRQTVPEKPVVIDVQPTGHNSLPAQGSTHVILS